MARITAEALDERERAAYRAGRRGTAEPAARPPVGGRPAGSALSLAFILGGAGAVLAPDPLPFPADVLALTAVALGGYLARPSPPAGDGPLVRAQLTALLHERRELLRAALALGLRGDDGGARGADRREPGPAGGEPGPDAGDDGPAGHPGVLHVVGGTALADPGEGLDADDEAPR